MEQQNSLKPFTLVSGITQYNADVIDFLAPECAKVAKDATEFPPNHYDVWGQLDRNSNFPEKPPYLQERECGSLALPKGQRQLFVDDHLLVQRTNVSRWWHRPVFNRSPRFALFPNKPWEGRVVVPHSGGVWYDAHEQLYKIFYRCGGNGWSFGALCMALSSDGIRWNKEIGLADGTNLVLNETLDSGTVILLANSSSCPWNLVMWPRVALTGGPRLQHYCSDTGRAWRFQGKIGGEETEDRFSMFWNPFRKKFVFLLKENNEEPFRERIVRYAEAPEIQSANWTWNAHIRQFVYRKWQPGEPVKQIGGFHSSYSLEHYISVYSADGFAYENLIVYVLGLIDYVNHTAHSRWYKMVGLQLAFSRDGFHMTRSPRRFIPSVFGEFNKLSSTPQPIVTRDSLYFYIGGFMAYHKKGATKLAILRRDGFASLGLRDSANVGCIVTRELAPAAGYLFLNVDTGDGEIVVEVLRVSESNAATADIGCQSGVVVSARSQSISTDSVAMQVDWLDGAELGVALDDTIQLRIHFRRIRSEGVKPWRQIVPRPIRLYSFWFDDSSKALAGMACHTSGSDACASAG